MMQTSKLREALAGVEHSRWARWQAYLHGKCVANASASVVEGARPDAPPCRWPFWVADRTVAVLVPTYSAACGFYGEVAGRGVRVARSPMGWEVLIRAGGPVYENTIFEIAMDRGYPFCTQDPKTFCVRLAGAK